MRKDDFPKWMKTVLQLAAIYNILWGAWIGFFPFQFFDWAEMARPIYPAI